MAPPPLKIHPPLLNSASPWATTKANLQSILLHPSTGAITTRTSLTTGFAHDHSRHQYLFFNPSTSLPGHADTSSTPEPPPSVSPTAVSSLNSLGYSPHSLQEYLSILQDLSHEFPEIKKTVIVSVAGTPEQISQSYNLISDHSSSKIHFPLAMEVNLSCPNIPSFPPPAYIPSSLAQYLEILPENPSVPIGIKTPPYTYLAQVISLKEPLRKYAGKISFITCVNTLGCSLVLDDACEPQLPGGGMGGMAGSALHPLALGNVKIMKDLLDSEEELAHVVIIGVGGVSDGQGYRRMRKVGAHAVALATALGRLGTQVFADIAKDIDNKW